MAALDVAAKLPGAREQPKYPATTNAEYLQQRLAVTYDHLKEQL